VANLGKQKGNAYSYVYQVSNKKDKTYEYKQLFVELSSCKKATATSTTTAWTASSSARTGS
jgi:hypothetical protein